MLWQRSPHTFSLALFFVWEMNDNCVYQRRCKLLWYSDEASLNVTKLSQLWDQRINWAWFSGYVDIVCYQFCSYVITCSIVWVKMGDYVRIYCFKFSFAAVLLDCSIVKVSTVRWQNYVYVFAGVKSRSSLQLMGEKTCLYK